MLKPTLVALCALAAQAAGSDTPESRLLAAAQQEGTAIVYSVFEQGLLDRGLPSQQ